MSRSRAAAAVILAATAATALATPSPSRADSSIAEAGAWGALEREGVSIAEDGTLRLDPGVARGSVVSPVIEPAGGFDRACPSWSASAIDGAHIEVQLAVALERDGPFSRWYPLATWAECAGEERERWRPPTGRLPRSAPADEAEPGVPTVDVDTLQLPRAARAIRWRLVLHAGTGDDGGGRPVVRRVALACWRADDRAPLSAERSPAWGRILEVPFRSQGWEDGRISGRVCSPTSLSMVLEHRGVKLPTAEVCRRVYDREADLFGNWSFNAAAASAAGVPMRVARFRSIEELEAEIEAGRPVVLSHRWGPGELTGAPVDASEGHLVVVVGFDESGDVVVNDPAGNPRRGRGPGRRVYARREIHRSWLVNASGIVYVLHEPD